jgi:transcriptional regulator of nitric oxide reductase
MPNDRPSDERPRWPRGRASRLRKGRRNDAARPWYADRLEQRVDRPEQTPLGPYETSYDVTDGYAIDRLTE